MEASATVTFCCRSRRRAVRTVISVIVFVMALDAAAQTRLLVVRPEGVNFKDAVKGMADDLGRDATIKEIVVDKHSESGAIAKAVQQYEPKAIMLMDNTAIRLYKDYSATLPDSEPVLPSISLIGILVGDAIAGLRNAEAISYEIPVVISVVNLRALTGRPIKRIGIIHREVMRNLIEQNRESCAREGITIVGKCLPNEMSFKESGVKKALTELFEEDKVDALWIPNDNVLLTPAMITEVWIPKVQKYRKPVIVGIEALAAPDLDFGTLAVLPDHVALGVQAAALVINAQENGWKVNAGAVEPALSVYKVLNLRQAAEYFKVQEKNITGIDKILK